MDETTELADLILPDHTYLEKWDLDFGVPNIPFLHVGLSQPVVEPVLDTRHTGEIIIQLAKMIDPLTRTVSSQNYLQTIRSQAKMLYDSGSGFIPTSDFGKFMYTYMLDRGFKYYKAEDFEQFWKGFVTHGSWLEMPAGTENTRSAFQTPSKKFEFASQILQEQFSKYKNNSSVQESRDPDLKLLPHYEPCEFSGAEDKYPLHLIPYHLVTLFEGEGANRPLLLEMVGYPHLIRWNSWAEINPETAHKWKIHDSDWVWLESEKERIKIRVKYFQGAMPGIVYLPIGLGHTTYGCHAKDRGVNPNQILASGWERFSGQFARQATRVRILKI